MFSVSSRFPQLLKCTGQMKHCSGLCEYGACFFSVGLVQNTAGRPRPNHGLTGKGKSGRKSWSWKKGPSQQVNIEGQVLFGVHPVTMALMSDHRHHLYSVYFDRKYEQRHMLHAHKNIQDLALQRKVPIKFVPKMTLTSLSGSRPHQGVCLDASSRTLPVYDPLQLMQSEILHSGLLWLLLYNIQDPMNLGAILRSSYFFSVDKIIVPSDNSCGLSPVVSKASSGALEVMNMCQIEGSYRSVRKLTQLWQSGGGQVVGTAALAEKDQRVKRIQDFSATSPTLLIIGNEGCGIDEDVLDLCDTLLTIPHLRDCSNVYGVNSLNVSVATGILIHWLQVWRQRS